MSVAFVVVPKVTAKSLDELDHFQMFGPGGLALGDWVWCLHCERAYQYGEYRAMPPDKIYVEAFGDDSPAQLCPYDGCDGDTVLDGGTFHSTLIEVVPVSVAPIDFQRPDRGRRNKCR